MVVEEHWDPSEPLLIALTGTANVPAWVGVPVNVTVWPDTWTVMPGGGVMGVVMRVMPSAEGVAVPAHVTGTLAVTVCEYGWPTVPEAKPGPDGLWDGL